MSISVGIGIQFDRVVIDSSGSEIILPLSIRQRSFVCSDAITEAKEWIKSSAVATLFVPSIKFTISGGLYPQTFPDDFKMSDALWDDATKTWTPEDEGEFEARITNDGTNYNLQIRGPFI